MHAHSPSEYLPRPALISDTCLIFICSSNRVRTMRGRWCVQFPHRALPAQTKPRRYSKIEALNKGSPRDGSGRRCSCSLGEIAEKIMRQWRVSYFTLPWRIFFLKENSKLLLIGLIKIIKFTELQSPDFRLAPWCGMVSHLSNNSLWPWALHLFSQISLTPTRCLSSSSVLFYCRNRSVQKGVLGYSHVSTFHTHTYIHTYIHIYRYTPFLAEPVYSIARLWLIFQETILLLCIGHHQAWRAHHISYHQRQDVLMSELPHFRQIHWTRAG